MNSSPGECPFLGRKPVCKESSKAFKATVAMSEDFPLSVEMLLNVLEVRSIYFTVIIIRSITFVSRHNCYCTFMLLSIYLEGF